MDDSVRGPGLGPLLGLLVTAALGSWLAGRALAAGTELAASPGRAADLPDAVSVLLLWAGCVAAAWYALTCAVALLIRLGRAAGATTSGLEDAVRRWGFPVLRRTLLTTVAAGAGLSLTIGAAGAAPPGGEPPVPHDLGWGAGDVSERPPAESTDSPVHATEVTAATGRTMTDGPVSDAPTELAATTGPTVATPPTPPAADAAPDAPPPPVTHGESATTAAQVTPGGGESRATPGTSAPPRPAPPDRAPAERRSAGDAATFRVQAATYRVQAGDSLWSIAAAHLGEGATTEEVARAWPEWYRANRPRLGPDPHLIHPDQLLQVPDEEAS